MWSQLSQLKECFIAIKRQFPDTIHHADIHSADKMTLVFLEGKFDTSGEIKEWILKNYEGSTVEYIEPEKYKVKIKLVPTVYYEEEGTTTFYFQEKKD